MPAIAHPSLRGWSMDKASPSLGVPGPAPIYSCAIQPMTPKHLVRRNPLCRRAVKKRATHRTDVQPAPLSSGQKAFVTHGSCAAHPFSQSGHVPSVTHGNGAGLAPSSPSRAIVAVSPDLCVPAATPSSRRPAGSILMPTSRAPVAASFQPPGHRVFVIHCQHARRLPFRERAPALNRRPSRERAALTFYAAGPV